MRLALMGAGGHGRSVAAAAVALARDDVIGFLDDDASMHGKVLGGLPVLGPASSWPDFGVDAILPAIGANQTRRDVVLREMAKGAALATLVHPRAIVCAGARLSEGATVLAGAIVNAGATVGWDAIVNSGSIVEHDCVIGAHAHIAPGCVLAGAVEVGEGSLIGIGSRILPGVRIGAWAVVGAGSVVTGDVMDGAVVAGAPARRIR